MVGVFLISALLSFSFPALFHFFDPFLVQLLAEAHDLHGLPLFFFIFKNNLLAAGMGVLGGVLFGIIPLGVGVVNGLLLGYVGAKVTATQGFVSLWRLLPHGIFELPALFLALALGIRLGVASGMLLLGFLRGSKKDDFLEVLSSSLITFCLMVLPLLFIAGVIESLLISVGV